MLEGKRHLLPLDLESLRELGLFSLALHLCLSSERTALLAVFFVQLELQFIYLFLVLFSCLLDLLAEGLPLLEERLRVLGLRGLIQQDPLLLDLEAAV